MLKERKYTYFYSRDQLRNVLWTKLYASAQMEARDAHASLIFAGFPLWRASHRPFSRPLSLRRVASCPRSIHFLPPTRDQTARIQNRIFPRHAPRFPQSRFPLLDSRHATLLSDLFLIVYRFFVPDRLYAYTCGSGNGTLESLPPLYARDVAVSPLPLLATLTTATLWSCAVYTAFWNSCRGLRGCARTLRLSLRVGAYEGELKRGEKGSFFPRFVVLSLFHISIFFDFDKLAFFFIFNQYQLSRCVRFLCRLNNS